MNFDYEVRSAKDAFSDVPEMKIKGEMLDLAKHIIETKHGTFDPSEYKDRYEAALAELVKAKLEGKPIPAKKAREIRKGRRSHAGFARKRGRWKETGRAKEERRQDGACTAEGELIYGCA